MVADNIEPMTLQGVELVSREDVPSAQLEEFSADDVQRMAKIHLSRYMRSKMSGHNHDRLSLLALIDKFSLAAPHSPYFIGPYRDAARFGLSVVQSAAPDIFPVSRQLQRATLRELGNPKTESPEIRRRNAMEIGMIGLAEIPGSEEIISTYGHKLGFVDPFTPTDEYSVSEQVSAGFGLLMYIAARSRTAEGQALPMAPELLQLQAAPSL